MISEIKDDEILEFLMTSELEGDYSPTELKYLLFKWRFFYRVLDGLLERTKSEKDGEIRNLKYEKELLVEQSNSLMIQNATKEDLINTLKTTNRNRKLTWRERIFGKIIE